MADLAIAKILLGNYAGAPGINQLVFSPGTASWNAGTVTDLLEDVDGMVSAWLGFWVPGMTITVDPEMRVYDSETGSLVASYNSTTPPATQDSEGADGQENRASQVLVRLATNTVHNRRAFQGRLFVGPISTGVLTSDGLVQGSVKSEIIDSMAGFITGLGPRLCVWHRPSTPVASDGFYEDVETVSVADVPAVLRSRRD